MHRCVKMGWLLATVAVAAPAFGQQTAGAAAPAAPPAESMQPPATAAAAEPKEKAGEEPFGKAGVINIGSDLQLNIQHTGYSSVNGASRSSITTYVIGPAADYFVMDNFSVGAAFEFGRASYADGAKIDLIGIEPRVGYHIPLVAEKFGLWPKLSFFYEHEKLAVEGFPDVTGKSLGVLAFLPLLIHPVEHFHFGIGPYFKTALSTKEGGEDAPKATTIGLQLEIAGWWKL